MSDAPQVLLQHHLKHLLLQCQAVAQVGRQSRHVKAALRAEVEVPRPGVLLAGAAGTYQPYQSGQRSDDDSASTAGVSESALDYVLGRQTPQSGSAADSSGASANPAQQAAQAPGDATATAAPEDASSDAAGEEANTPRDLRGILAIEDLDKLGDSVRPPPPEEDEENPPDNGN